MAPACTLAGFTGLTDENGEQVYAMACCFNHAVAVWANDVTEGGKKLNQDRGGIRFRVRLDRSNDFTGQAVQGRWVEYRPAIRRCDISAFSDKRVIGRLFATTQPTCRCRAGAAALPQARS